MAFKAHLHGGPYDGQTMDLTKFNAHIVVSEELAIKARLMDPPEIESVIDRKGVYAARPGTITGNQSYGSADYDWGCWSPA